MAEKTLPARIQLPEPMVMQSLQSLAVRNRVTRAVTRRVTRVLGLRASQAPHEVMMTLEAPSNARADIGSVVSVLGGGGHRRIALDHLSRRWVNRLDRHGTAPGGSDDGPIGSVISRTACSSAVSRSSIVIRLVRSRGDLNTAFS